MEAQTLIDGLITALCRCAVGNVGLKVGIKKVELHILSHALSDFLEIL